MTESRKHESRSALARAAHVCWGWLWRSVAIVLIGTAVLLTIARLLLPFAGEYRAELVERVESYLGYQVEIGELDIAWQGLGPRLHVTNLRVHGLGPGAEPMRFEQAYVGLRPVLRDGLPSFRLDNFSVAGFTIRLRRDEEGRLHAFGTTLDPVAIGALPATAVGGGGEAAADPAGADADAAADVLAALEQVFSIPRLHASDATLIIEQPDGAMIRWSDLAITLANAGRNHRIAVSVSPPPFVGTRFAAQLEFVGTPAAYREWRASLYLDVRSLSLEQAAGLWPGAPVDARGGRLDGQLWSEWRDGRLIEARAVIGADEVSVAGAGETVRLERLGGRARVWQPNAGQWQVDVADLEVRRDGRTWTGGQLSYAFEDDRDWRISADFLRAEDVAALAALLPMEDATRARLRAHAPRGDVRDMNLAVSADGRFRLRGAFRDLGWAARGNIPGLTGLDGRLQLRSDGGHVRLDSGDVAFDAPELFRDPLKIEQLGATVNVKPTEDGFDLNATHVELRNKDLRGSGRARVEVGRGHPPRLDLQFRYRDGVGTAVPTYLPAGIMPPPVVKWLDQAFRAGRVPSGSFIMRGSTEDFPYREHKGIFDVRFEMVETTLHYADGWPVIEDLSGEVRFAGASLDIHAERGRTRRLQLERGHARFDDLKTGQLEVDVDAAGPLGDMFAVVADSPIGPRFDPVLEGTRANGDASLSLALSVPVETPEETRVRGAVRLDGAGISRVRHDLDFDRIRGTVGFTHASVTAVGLSARLRGRPIRVDVDTRDGVAGIRLAGPFAPSELLPALSGGVLSADGRSDWNVSIDVPLRGDAEPRLVAGSDLVGTGLDLPAPLGKMPETRRPLRVDMPFGGEAVRVRYGENIRLVLDLGQGEGLDVRRVGVAFDEPARLPARDGLRVAGSLDVLPLAGWLSLVGGNDESGPALLPLVEIALSARTLELGAYRLSNVRLEGQRDRDDMWMLRLDSDEADGRLRGDMTRPGGPPIDIRFDLIDVALIRPPEAEQAQSEPIRFDDPASLPPLDIRIERMKFPDYTLRDVNLLTGSAGGGMTIHQLGFRTEHLEANGQGKWHGGKDMRTDLRMVIRSSDFGAGLREIGRGGMLADGDGKVTLDIGWPGLPWEPSLATVAGDVDIDIEDGVLTEVDPGAARLLGLFSLEAMPLRSLIQSGLIFSELQGRVDLVDGDAFTRLLKIDSTVGLIKIYGRTGLVARDYDQRVVVQPELSTSLPLIGFLSGGPVAGAAIALLQGVMRNAGQDIEKSGRIEYSITGSWDEPVIERIRAEAEDEESPELRR